VLCGVQYKVFANTLIDYGSSSSQFNAVLYGFVLFYVLLYPVFVGLFLHVIGPKNIRKKHFRERFRSFYSGLFLKNSINLHQVTVFLVRRLLIGLSIAFLRTYHFLQLEVFLVTSLFVCCFNLSLSPFDTSLGNALEVANELLVLLTVYILHGFTFYIPSAEARFNIGWLYIQIVAIVFILNLVYMMHLLVYRIKIWVKMNPQNKYLQRFRNSAFYKFVFSRKQAIQIRPLKVVSEVINQKDRVVKLAAELVMAPIKEGSREDDSEHSSINPRA
jgi:hypothetical protein